MTNYPKSWKYDEIEGGQKASLERKVHEFDIVDFAKVTGDKNPLHMDAEYAEGTIFKKRVAHGVLSLGYISAVFAMELPGPGAILIGFDKIRFVGPVFIGQKVKAEVTVIELMPGKKRVRFECCCWADGKIVLSGEAVLKVAA